LNFILLEISTAVMKFGAAAIAVAAAVCPPADFDTIDNFDLAAYSAKRWYIHQQMPTKYLPVDQNFCVYANYEKLEKKSFWGYDIDVHNHAEEKDGTVYDSDKRVPGGIKAKIEDEKRGKLQVGPGFLPPQIGSGEYWILDYVESEGYALISGGAPKFEGKDGKCTTGSGVNGSGLWIFTRESKRDDALIQKVRDIASDKGFDLSVLNDVDHTKCTATEAIAEVALSTIERANAEFQV